MKGAQGSIPGQGTRFPMLQQSTHMLQIRPGAKNRRAVRTQISCHPFSNSVPFKFLTSQPNLSKHPSINTGPYFWSFHPPDIVKSQRHCSKFCPLWGFFFTSILQVHPAGGGSRGCPLTAHNSQSHLKTGMRLFFISQLGCKGHPRKAQPVMEGEKSMQQKPPTPVNGSYLLDLSKVGLLSQVMIDCCCGHPTSRLGWSDNTLSWWVSRVAWSPEFCWLHVQFLPHPKSKPETVCFLSYRF